MTPSARVSILRFDVQRGQEACTLEILVTPSDSKREPLAVHLGLRYVHGLGEARQARIVERRGNHPFEDL